MSRFLITFAIAGTALGQLLTAASAYAWGAAGHEAVCQIAYRELSAQGQKWVDDILKLETVERFKTFHGSCGWPDARTAETNARRSEHFVNVPRSWTTIPSSTCDATDRCLFTAITHDISVLEDDNSTRREKLSALKFLGHWLGDIHQPLHISYEDDKGGNDIAVDGVTGCSPSNKKLHSVWDVCIVEGLMTDKNDREGFGNELQEAIVPGDRTKWLQVKAPDKWADESYKIAREPDVKYCVVRGNVCRYSREDREYDGDEDNKRTVSTDNSYKTDFGPIVKARLQQAGVRLGTLLQAIADGKHIDADGLGSGVLDFQ